MSTLILSIYILYSCLRATYAQAQVIPATLTLSAPDTAVTIDPAIVSFSLEQDGWTDWAGTTSPNLFFYNILDNLKQRTGTAPWLRIGADSEDHTDFSNTVQFEEAIYPPFTAITPYPEATNITVGDKYYELVKNLPSGTHVIWGLNLGQNNLTAVFLSAQSIKKAFASHAVRSARISLEFIEIGNEPDFYQRNSLRNASFNVAEYVKEWTAFAQNVSATAGITPSSETKYIAGAFARSSHNATSFSPQGMFANGMLNSTQGKLITAVSQHCYSGAFCTGSAGLLQDLMGKASIRGNLSAFIPDIAATRAQGLDYIFGETNSYACHGTPGVSNTAGAALWLIDYTLYGAQLSITRMHFHQGIGYKYNLIQPVSLSRSPLDGSNLATPMAPHIQPPYYGGILVSEAIGHSGSVKTVEIPVTDSFISAYAFYEHGQLKRAVIINSEAYTSSSTAPRSSKKIMLNVSGRKQQKMSIKRLKINYADDVSGLTWGGQTFETADGRPKGQPTSEVAKVSDGVAISATEAILLCFN